MASTTRPSVPTESASDFPLLEHLWGSDLGPLSGQWGRRWPFLQDAGFWPSKRSELSATE
jgi:hypothetical protein